MNHDHHYMNSDGALCHVKNFSLPLAPVCFTICTHSLPCTFLVKLLLPEFHSTYHRGRTGIPREYYIYSCTTDWYRFHEAQRGAQNALWSSAPGFRRSRLDLPREAGLLVRRGRVATSDLVYHYSIHRPTETLRSYLSAIAQFTKTGPRN